MHLCAPIRIQASSESKPYNYLKKHFSPAQAAVKKTRLVCKFKGTYWIPIALWQIINLWLWLLRKMHQINLSKTCFADESHLLQVSASLQRVCWYSDEKPQVSNDLKKRKSRRIWFQSREYKSSVWFSLFWKARGHSRSCGRLAAWQLHSHTLLDWWESFVECLCTATMSFSFNWL